jgi:RNA polymerase sigma-70 factor (ECF subfamily)
MLGENMEAVNDKELVGQLLLGDQEAFLEIVNRYSQKVHNLALRITRNSEDTEEVIQDVFVTVYRKISAFKGESAFSSWLYRITANTAFMKLRKRKQTVAVSLEDIKPSVKEAWIGERSDQTDINFICSQHQLRDQLELAISKLPEEYRVIFVLRDIDGLSNQEVGEILSLSIPAVKSRLHRSRIMLRKKLHKFYSEYSDTKIDLNAATYSEELISLAA